jgi:hypothetical protein
MTDITISHPRMALTLTEAMKGQIANGPEGRRLQEQIYKALDDFYKLLDGHGFFCDQDGRRPLGTAIVVTCDTRGGYGNNCEGFIDRRAIPAAAVFFALSGMRL